MHTIRYLSSLTLVLIAFGITQMALSQPREQNIVDYVRESELKHRQKIEQDIKAEFVLASFEAAGYIVLLADAPEAKELTKSLKTVLFKLDENDSRSFKRYSLLDHLAILTNRPNFERFRLTYNFDEKVVSNLDDKARTAQISVPGWLAKKKELTMKSPDAWHREKLLLALRANLVRMEYLPSDEPTSELQQVLKAFEAALPPQLYKF